MRSTTLSATVVVMALVAGAIAVGLWLWNDETLPAQVAEVFERAPEPDEHTRAELEPTPQEPTRASAVEPLAEPVPQETEPDVGVAAVEPDGSPAVPTVEVSIVVIEVDGTELRDANGIGEAVLWTGQFGSGSHFELHSGRFSLPTVEGLSRIDIRTCEIDGEPLDCREATLTLPHEGALVFVLRRPVGLRLRVIASDTRVDLADVQIVTGAPFDYLENPSGRATTTIVLGGRSPLDLPPRVGRDTDFWVHAPGYAWQRVQLDLIRGGERSIQLEPAGAVVCTILGAALPEGATLRGWRGAVRGAPGVDFEAVREKPLEIDGLTAGEWCFKVQLGPLYGELLDLAVGAVTVVAGRTQDLVLTVGESAQAPARMDVHGVVRIDGTWQGLDRLRFMLHPEGDVQRWAAAWMQVVPVHSGSQYTWKVPQLYAGRYMVVVSPSEHRQLLEVTADGSNEFVIEVPPPADVEVTVVDAETGIPIAVEYVIWHSQVPAGVSGFEPEIAPYDPERGARFQAPIGQLSLRAIQEGLAGESEEVVELVRGVNRVTLRVDRACGLRVEYFDGETPIPLSDPGMFELEPIDHDGRKSTYSNTWSHVSAPGRYMVTFKSPRGFQPVPPREVTIPAGEMINVRVNLERNP